MEIIIIKCLFIALILSFSIRHSIFKFRKIQTKGMPPVNKVMFRIGKLTLFASWILLMLHINIIDISIIANNIWIQRVAIVLLALGVILNIASSINLGLSFRMGLPKENIILKTNGVYQFSRNPMLLSLFLISIASSLYTLSPIVWVLTVTTILIHHRIIVAEEEFLRERFGNTWVNYSKNVRRYL